MTHHIRRIGVMTGGGDCPGLNAVIRAVTKTAIQEYGLEVIGLADGYTGLVENRMRPLGWDDVSSILTQGGTILGTSNKANPFRYCTGTDPAGNPVFADLSEQALAHAEQAGLDAVVAIGGDGTMSIAARLAERGLPIVGVPKTIDNDLVGTEVTFGFDTAVQTATDALDRLHTTAFSHHRVMIAEVMGRYAGWIALHAGLAGGGDVILMPELPYQVEAICECCMRRVRRGRRFSIICIAEGAHPAGGQMTVQRTVPDSHDPIRLGGVGSVLADQIQTHCGLEARAVVLGHVLRGGTPTAFDRVLATYLGWHAMERVAEGQFGELVVYNCGTCGSIPLAAVADKVRTVPIDHPLLQAARRIGVSLGQPRERT